jgi:hypothetical protein
MNAQLIAMRTQRQSSDDLRLYANCIGWANEMSAAEFQRHFLTFDVRSQLGLVAHSHVGRELHPEKARGLRARRVSD